MKMDKLVTFALQLFATRGASLNGKTARREID